MFQNVEDEKTCKLIAQGISACFSLMGLIASSAHGDFRNKRQDYIDDAWSAGGVMAEEFMRRALLLEAEADADEKLKGGKSA